MIASSTDRNEAQQPSLPTERRMIVLTSHPPAFCPSCGSATGLDSHLLLHAEYEARHSFTCQACGSVIQLADEENLLEAASSSGGDLKQELKR